MRSNRLFSLALLLLLASGAAVHSQEQDPDISGCDIALERFFYGGKENLQNRQRIYYDAEGRVVLSFFLNSDGTERSRKLYRYDERGNQIEYSLEDKTASGWNRWWHTVGERSDFDDYYQITQKTARYRDAYVVTSVVRKTYDEVVLYEEDIGFDGSTSVREYNSNGDLIRNEYENEKSDGRVLEEYEYEYEEGRPIKRTTRRGSVVSEVRENTYKDGLLVESRVGDLLKNATYTYRYEYSDGKLTKQTCLSADGAPLFMLFYEYDDRGRLVRHGERYGASERYWQYDFED